MNVDIAIVGAGPAGLCLARALSGHGLSIAILEQQPRAALAEPAFDGREIALTPASSAELQRLGIWSHIAAEDIAPLRDAQVLNGPSPFALKIAANLAGQSRLGQLVANRAIRRAAYQVIADCSDVTLLDERRVIHQHTSPTGVKLRLDDDSSLDCRLLVAADSRFSQTRRQLGIPASQRDFGKSMLVCRMQHELPHHSVAWEWFGYGQTLALLPLNGDQSSVVLTLEPKEIERLQHLEAHAFAQEIEQRFDKRLGSMQLLSSRHVYPLVGVHAQRLWAPRAALVGDAAVGMHPVTAHGFNFGLLSQQRLARLILAAHAKGQDIGASSLLQRYNREQQLATWPLYQFTNLLVGLYTDDRLPSRLLRNGALRLAQGLKPLRGAIAKHLTKPAGG
ncbi:5-demethoxyubiquinol-8 5-hydroxylase UbiM [Pseudomonas sp. LRF_L74]|uniref:5-demethoxyubiquinol-8 5-hydroxylase UbiM n=1 Tax=Pseudomonas sp. LRF_L74 TaxID=3369422 RepID=UPI003F606B70